MNALETKWTQIARDQLVGRTIRSVRYMTDAERQDMMWVSRPIVIELDNGSLIWPTSDDEGNNGGAIATTNDDQPVLPLMR